MFSIDCAWSSTSLPLALGAGASSLGRSCSSSSSASGDSADSSKTGFSTSSWASRTSSSMRVICSSLIACCSDGVITSFCASLSESFCSRAMPRPLESEVLTQVNLAHLRVGGELLGCARFEDGTVVDDVGPVRDLQGLPHVVVGDQDADSHLLQVPDDSLDVDDRDRIDAGERLVEEDIPRADHQGAGDL